MIIATALSFRRFWKNAVRNVIEERYIMVKIYNLKILIVPAMIILFRCGTPLLTHEHQNGKIFIGHSIDLAVVIL
jgi:hypothetical protein